MTRPLTPSSATSKFAPSPRKRIVMPASFARWRICESSSALRGSAKYSAGPPSLNQVSGPSGTFRRHASGQSLNKLIRYFPDVAGAHGQDNISRCRVRHYMIDDFLMTRQVQGVSAVCTDAGDKVPAADRITFGLTVPNKK